MPNALWVLMLHMMQEMLRGLKFVFLERVQPTGMDAMLAANCGVYPAYWLMFAVLVLGAVLIAQCGFRRPALRQSNGRNPILSA